MVDLGVYPVTSSKVRALETTAWEFPPTKFMPYLLVLVKFPSKPISVVGKQLMKSNTTGNDLPPLGILYSL